jgi:hypothetical protein
MQTNILWTGREYYSLENCLLTRTDLASKANSVIIGMHHDNLYRVEYLIKTNENWETTFLELKTQVSDKLETLRYESDGKGNWTNNRKTIYEFSGCIDIDISLTPFTNTLPVNRLKLAINESQEISVLYLDILEQQVKRIRQKYTRLSETEYKFQNVTNDFEAIITIDELGLVVDYPELFERTYICKSNYDLFD